MEKIVIQINNIPTIVNRYKPRIFGFVDILASVNRNEYKYNKQHLRLCHSCTYSSVAPAKEWCLGLKLRWFIAVHLFKFMIDTHYSAFNCNVTVFNGNSEF